ncbi:MAG: M20/M25/M40 family metallo-hydrolase [Thaumarchaeota archaeon]|nr:M20/M25/M40 family metallo-hydrolase [Candidatus Calditenuaceae archaeon]MDW8187157.1 M20/M25/M40 family metallo-hydrolase [Nitrososphaerota archaeon]
MHELVERLWRRIKENEGVYVGRLKRLLEKSGVSATGEGIEEASSVTRELMSEVGLRTETLDTGGYPAVFGEAKEERHGTLLFYNHYDVQPPDPVELWESPPFSPSVRAGRVFARGSADNKGNLVARLCAVEAVREVAGELPVNVKFLAEGEEEIGSPNLPMLVRSRGYLLEADACLWEMSHIDDKDRPVISLGVKGLVYLELVARRRGGDLHSSWGAVSVNPAWRLMGALGLIADVFGTPKLAELNEDVDLDPKFLKLIEESDYDFREIEEGAGELIPTVRGDVREALKRLTMMPVVNVCGIHSGYTGKGSKTVLPSEAFAKVDVRLVPRMRPEKVIESVRRALRAGGYGDIEVKQLGGSYPAARTAPESPFAEAVAQTARVAFEKEPVVLPSMQGSGPMYLFTEVLGQPCVLAGVSRRDSRYHAPNENLRIDDYLRGIFHVSLLMLNFVPMMRWGVMPYR